MTTPQKLQKWLDDVRYLPPFMRDFHDQKELFRTVDEIVKPPEGHDFIKRPNWVEAQCYTVDVFLRFMARRGYTLQRSQANLPFRDLGADVERVINQQQEQAASLLASAFQGNKP